MTSKKQTSNTEFSRFIIEMVEKDHPAMLVLDPDDYNVLSEADKAEANKLARTMNESIFAKDKTTCLLQLRGRFGGACVKKILMDMRPTDGWVGKVTVGTIKPSKTDVLYKDKLDKHYPDIRETWK